jgi:SAM-dependent methyltransferase
MVGHSPHTLKPLLARIGGGHTGLEVAPYFEPIARKADHRVFYTDYVDPDGLRAKAASYGDGMTRDVVPIDFVWTPGRPLRDCAPAHLKFDYAIASHVMEHVPDPLGWVNELLSVMDPGGIVALFLPNRRTCMDFNRNPTTFAQVVEWWATRPALPTVGQIADFVGHSGWAPPGEAMQWADGRPANLRRSYSDVDVVNFAELMCTAPQYIDVHCSVWEPDRFVDVFRRAAKHGLLNPCLAPSKINLILSVSCAAPA